ncbi:MAG: hypothetical protein FWF50_02335 [Defluviitaleaceae bacterium]|nr:hypothetical protein [Defluviitaleaceae bacterium]
MYNYNEAINFLTSKFSNLKSIYESEIDEYEGLPYIFYESVFIKYIVEKINSRDEVELYNIFNFVEDMLLNGDEEIKNLIEVAVIESLYYEEDFSSFNTFLPTFYGDLTKKSFESFETH